MYKNGGNIPTIAGLQGQQKSRLCKSGFLNGRAWRADCQRRQERESKIPVYRGKNREFLLF